MTGIILNIETSTKVCSVSITRGEEVLLLKESLDESYSHSEKLNVFIREALEESKFSMAELSAISVSKGPGSFTGLRIGVSTAKGFAYALDLPLISCSTLACLAIGFAEKTTVGKNDLIIPMIDARRREVYMQIFDNEVKSISEIEAKEIDVNSFNALLKEKEKIHLIGDGAMKFSEEFMENDSIVVHDSFLASATYMARSSAIAFQDKNFEDLAYFEPYYLKDFIAIKPRKIF